ncbi:MAG: tetratricopeptide repeat protein [Burkholderiales bacterium]
MSRRLCLLLIVLLGANCAFADAKKAADKAHRAEQEFRRHNIAGAEKLLRDAIKEDPDYIDAHSMLANLLSSTNRYSQAAQEYGRALELDAKQNKLSDEDKRRLADGQAVAYAESGDLQRAKTLYLDALKNDPDYAMYNYNLACVYAELHDLESALRYLKKAWEKRGNMPSDTPFPDPRKDSSFKEYVNDARFQDAVRNMVQ